MKALVSETLFFVFVLFNGLNAQPFVSYIQGDTGDVVTNPLPGLVLAGGGDDNDQAMKWMLQRADSGDVVVIRASGGAGYNSYFMSLGVPVHSVETIVFQHPSASYHPYPLRRLAEAEVVFIAGGDQYDYYQLWHDTPVEDTLRYLIQNKKITVGGTSAGMMILGQVYYVPFNLGIISSEALSNPYHANMNMLGNADFVNHPWLSSTVCDTHFDERDRQGRLVAFMARMEKDYGLNSRGIACNEGTAVCIDSSGLARVFGYYPPAPDYAYFVQSYCDQPLSLPETCLSAQPLHWYHGGKALIVYRVVGKPNGSNYFNVKTWDSGAGGQWFWWYVSQGTLFTTPGMFEECTWSEPIPFTSQTIQAFWQGETLTVQISSAHVGGLLEIICPLGKVVYSTSLRGHFFSQLLPLSQGLYLINILLPDGLRLQKKIWKF
ncbi:MAG: cyanophycinase [Flavobacteriales bacterium]|nr:cyanophycinase [Flavobacteriales bacterium]MCX7768649.1 cyanophycinase [Flavobacteriales bacterium]MDW8410361.1 cyanophycinase [Flavobacteriales bacterium]